MNFFLAFSPSPPPPITFLMVRPLPNAVRQRTGGNEEEEEEEEPLLIYTAQGSPFRCKKLSVINGSPERRNDVLPLVNRPSIKLIDQNDIRFPLVSLAAVFWAVTQRSPNRSGC